MAFGRECRERRRRARGGRGSAAQKRCQAPDRILDDTKKPGLGRPGFSNEQLVLCYFPRQRALWRAARSIVGEVQSRRVLAQIIGIKEGNDQATLPRRQRRATEA